MIMKKRLIVLGMTVGLVTGLYTYNGTEIVQANKEVNVSEVSNDKELYKGINKIKLPTRVYFKEESGKKTNNKSNNYKNAILNETSSTGTLNYQHIYFDDENTKNQRVSLNVITKNTLVDLEDVTFQTELTLDNGNVATFIKNDEVQTLSFNEGSSGLFYCLVGEKKKGEFSPEELLDIANSMQSPE
jgi:hypothetical protein